MILKSLRSSAEAFSLCAQQRTCVYAVKVRCPPEQGKD